MQCLPRHHVRNLPMKRITLLLITALQLPAIAGASAIDAMIINGEYSQAYQTAHQALATASDNTARQQAKRDLARVLIQQDKLQRAESLLHELLHGDDVVVPDTLLYADIQDAQVSVLRRTLRSKEALPYAEQALALRRKLLGEEHLLVAESLNNLALLLVDMKKTDTAKVLYQQALTMRQKIAGSESYEAAETLHNLGTLYARAKQYDNAEQQLLSALRIKQKILRPNHPRILNTLSRLGSVYTDKKHYPEAITTLNAVMDGMQENGMAESVIAGITQRELADVYHYQRQIEAAERYYKASLGTLGKVLGTQHYAYGVALNGLGWLYYKNGRAEDGKKMIAESESIMDKAPR